MQPRLALLLSAVLVFAGCNRQDDAAVRHYETRGIVRSIAPDRSMIEVEHENIPGFMPSMTMPFTPRDQKQIVDLRVNDAIAFRVDVTNSDIWIANVKRIDAGEVRLPKATPATNAPPITSTRLKEGDVMPVFSLTNEQGEHVTRETYRGRPFVLTFIFTRCPVPNFCPRMSNNFAQLQAAIKNGAGSLAQTRLLSITLDPKFDTPAILKQYGEHAGTDPRIWNFATGEPSEIDDLTHAFAVYRLNEGGTISHGLTTALIDSSGIVTKIWRGNAWSVAEVIDALNGNAPSEKP